MTSYTLLQSNTRALSNEEPQGLVRHLHMRDARHRRTAPAPQSFPTLSHALEEEPPRLPMRDRRSVVRRGGRQSGAGDGGMWVPPSRMPTVEPSRFVSRMQRPIWRNLSEQPRLRQPVGSQCHTIRNTMAHTITQSRANNCFSVRVQPPRSIPSDFLATAIQPPVLLVETPALREAYCVGQYESA